VSLRVELLALVLLASVCRPAPAPAPEPEPGGSGGSVDSHDADVREPEVEPEIEADPEAQARAIEGSPCELACADVYECWLVEGHEQAAAAKIELLCLGACVRASEAFASCERPGSITADQCAGYLGCVREAWPEGAGPSTIIDSSVDGCGGACGALGRCAGATLDEIEACTRDCRKLDNPELDRLAAECAELDDCPSIIGCVLALPGAGPN
jgi:hypothetical protein